MGDWPRLVNLRRCARGQVHNPGSATNSTTALTNNSTGAELILVWQFGQFNPDAVTFGFSYQQIAPMATLGTVAPIVPGDASPPGVLSTGDQATAFAPDFISSVSGFALAWAATFPFAVLLPGWSLVAQQNVTPTAGFSLALWWEAILPKYFDRMHTHYYLELALAQQGG